MARGNVSLHGRKLVDVYDSSFSSTVLVLNLCSVAGWISSCSVVTVLIGLLLSVQVLFKFYDCLRN